MNMLFSDFSGTITYTNIVVDAPNTNCFVISILSNNIIVNICVFNISPKPYNTPSSGGYS